MADNRPIIVVADDEPDILATLTTYLAEHLDADIEPFEGPVEALARIEEDGVDLLLADFRMPEMDGLELVRRSQEAIPDLGAMMITAYPDIDLAIRAINEGHIMHFFTKPPEPEELIKVIRDYLQDLRRTQDRHAAFERALALGRRSARQGSGAGT